MSSWASLAVVLVALFLVYGWFSDRRSAKRQAEWAAEAEERSTSEELVIKTQAEFEKRVYEGVEIGVPDAVRGRELHIYRYPMREWFNKLTAQSRYDEPRLRKLREDWLVYMSTLEMMHSSQFLSLESNDEAKREKYGRQAQEERMQLTAIEDGFAEAVGAEAVERLRQTRTKDWKSFSALGELAPDGHYYPGWPHGELCWPLGKPLPPAPSPPPLRHSGATR